MKAILLFLTMFMLLFLWLVPICFPFGYHRCIPGDTQAWIGAAYAFWYLMMFILTCCFGEAIRKNGCWFFKKD